VPAWVVGAFEAETGARITGPHGFEHGRHEIVADVELMPGGVVRDRDGHPIGNARVFLHVTYGDRTDRTTIIADPSGPHVGEVSAGFRCGDARALECTMPGFLPIGKKSVDVVPGVDEHELTVVMDRAPGKLMLGRIVDPTGLPVALEAILERRFAIHGANQRSPKSSVWAITAGVKPPPLLAGSPTDATIVEGRLDFGANMYEFVLPEEFRGSLQLQISKHVVATAPLGDLARAPDLICDEGVLPDSMKVKNVAVRYVDAESKQPIDLRGEQLPLTAMDPTGTCVPMAQEESDPNNGLIVDRCASASLRFDSDVAGCAAGLRFVDIPAGPAAPAAAPLIIEAPPAAKTVHGFALHADGRPLAKAALAVFCRTDAGIIDATTQPTVTSEEGEFECAGLAKGEHLLVVSAEPEEAPAAGRLVASDGVTEVELKTSLGVATSFRLVTKPEVAHDWKIRCFRLSDRSGLALVRPRCDWPKLTSSNDAIVLALAPGRCTVDVQPPHFREAKLEFDVPAPVVIEIPVEPNEAPKK
jgi:hypothetical protein